MTGAVQIAVDLEQGEVRLGAEQVRLVPVAGDVFCLNDERGPLVRALKFEERSLLLADAAGEDVASRIAEAALVSSGDRQDDVRIAASLALAGGGENAPAFPECARFVAQQHGWDAQRVSETMALVVDRLCANIVPEESNGWKQIVFQPNLDTLISQMVTNLSQRAVVVASEVDVEAEELKKTPRRWSSVKPFVSLSTDDYEPEARAKHGSIQSASSAVPVNRVAARVLALNTDVHRSNEAPVIPGTLPQKQDQPVTPASKPQPAPMLSTIPTRPQKTNFATTPRPQTNPTNFSLCEGAGPARFEPSTVTPPVASFPTWQSLATSFSKQQISPDAVHTSSRGFGVAAAEPQPGHDWLAEVAQLLEAECDMRGIDP